jgi:chemosensory pili system protein ChpA (sensor histidine kinase/response regulator)
MCAKGYAVEIADTGEKTLERLRADPLPDLLILDYELPGLDGEAVLQQIRADARLHSLPILMATAAKVDLARLARVNGVLHKPYPRELLMGVVKNLLPVAPGSAAR